MFKGKKPPAVGLVRHIDIVHEHDLTMSSVSGPPPSRNASRRRVDDSASIHEVLQHSPPLPEIPAPPSPFIVKRSADPKAQQKERKSMPHPSTAAATDDGVKEQQARNFRTWRDTTDVHWQHAALASYKDGVVHLSSSDGTLLEIPEEKLSQDDLNYLHSQDVNSKARPKVNFCPLFPSQFTDIIWNRMTGRVWVRSFSILRLLTI